MDKDNATDRFLFSHIDVLAKRDVLVKERFSR
jgi:hypothetical protein